MSLREKVLRQSVSRISKVIDDEENSHMDICDGMIALSTGSELTGQTSLTPTKLIESLQYFDRMQQRSRYIGALISAVIELDSDDEFLTFAKLHSKSSPIETDGQWLTVLIQELHSKEDITDVS